MAISRLIIGDDRSIFVAGHSMFMLRSRLLKTGLLSMALSTSYLTVPFLVGANNMLHPGTPRRSFSRAHAIATADRLAPFYAGVIVLRDRDDPAAGIFLEPVPVCVIGDVPRDLFTALAA